MSANLLSSFFNPFAQEKFIGWEQGIPNKPTGIDDLRIFYPQRHFTVQTVLSGQIPFWNPYNNSGNYLIGLSETAVFYPFFFIFFFLPQIFAWVVLILIEPLFVGVGMYLYLTLLFRDKKIASFGAVVFAFSGIVIVRSVEGLSVGHTLLWLPFAFYGIEAFFQKKKLRYLIVTLSALSLSVLAGWFQFTFYIFVFSFLYAVCKIFNKKFSAKYFFVFLPFVLTPLLTLFHIIPAVESLLTSPRGTQSISQILELHLMPVTHIFTFLFPDLWGNPGAYTFFGKSEYKESILYIGVIPFIVSLFSIAKLKNKFVLFFSAFGIISLFLGLDTSLTKDILSFPLPIVSTFLPNRIFLITSFSFSILSAYGLSVLLKNVSKKTVLFVGVIVLFILLSVDGYVFALGGFSFLTKYHFIETFKNNFFFLNSLQLASNKDQLTVISRGVLLPTLLVIIFAICFFISKIIKKPSVVFYGIILLTAVGQVYFAQRYIPFSNPRFMFPNSPVFLFLQKNAGINRFISTQDAYISSDIPLFYNIYSPDGVGSMYISRYGELVTYMQTQGKSFTDIPRIETRIDPSVDSIFKTQDPYLLKFMQLDGITYVVTLKKNNVKPSNNFSLVWENSTWQIYSYKNVLPRFFLTSSYILEKKPSQELSQIFKQDAKTVVLEENPGFISNVQNTGTVKLISYTPNKIQFTVSAKNTSLLFLSDTFTPNFTAFVDNTPTKILRADYAFRAIVVPSGNHTVLFLYKDTKETIAFILSFVTFLAFIALIIYLCNKKKINI